MKLESIWKKIGVQSVKVTQHTDGIVFVGEKQYIITGIKYENGKWIGFEAEEIKNDEEPQKRITKNP
jgi:acetate kinase